MRRLKTRELRGIYWTLTLLFIVPQAWSAVQYLVDAPRMTATLLALGYPAYFMKILGVAKLLGIAAIVTALSPTLKEWAYAGFTFETIGASVSHLSAGDPLWVGLVPLGFAIVQLASYTAWKRLGTTGRRRRYFFEAVGGLPEAR
jgi:hypothetical protein